MKILSLAMVALSITLSGPVAAQDYPTRTISLVVPFPAGGVADQQARLIAKELGNELGTSVVVENKAGAGGVIGAQFVAKASPDGYTILLGSDTAMISHPLVAKNPLYFPDKAFAPVNLVSTTPWILGVRPDAPYKTLRELVDFARKDPGKVTFFTVGNGSSHHVMGALLEKAAGVKLMPIPYKGGPQGFQDFFGGRLDVMMDYSSTWAPHVAAGKVNLIGVAAPARISSAQSVPTFAEQGYNLVYGPISVVAVPAATPKPVIDKLAAAMARVHAVPDVVKYHAQRGSVQLNLGPVEAKAFLEQRLVQTAQLFKELGIQPE